MKNISVIGAGTMGNGVNGQIKIITMIVDGGNSVVTPANLTGGSTITFQDVGDTVTCLFTNNSWVVISNVGCAIA